MEKINLRWLIIGSLAVIVVTQIACTAWIAKDINAYSPTDNSSELADVTKRLAGIESAVSDVQGTADNIQGRTGALTESMSSVARACAYR